LFLPWKTIHRQKIRGYIVQEFSKLPKVSNRPILSPCLVSALGRMDIWDKSDSLLLSTNMYVYIYLGVWPNIPGFRGICLFFFVRYFKNTPFEHEELWAPMYLIESWNILFTFWPNFCPTWSYGLKCVQKFNQFLSNNVQFLDLMAIPFLRWIKKTGSRRNALRRSFYIHIRVTSKALKPGGRSCSLIFQAILKLDFSYLTFYLSVVARA
jgi:hypothetical protein